MIRRPDWIALTKDRLAIILLIVMIIGAIAIIITTILRIHPSDIQIPVRFTGYGQSNIDRDQWYSQLSYGLFSVVLVAINGYLAIKLLNVNRMLGIGLMSMSIFLLVLCLIIANAIFNLAPSL
ncbi:MAG TPA: hypothetical protein VFO38_05420 [Candidatus Saccharimonadales bacterium]|nr:hypothetical protein [Candidatus Saccharimonadales bacterium]